jgi:large subunit ribosomal protein L9
MATPGNMKTYEKEKYLKARKLAENHRDAELKKEEIEKISLTVAVKVGEDDRLFGSVTTHTISDLLKEKNYDFNHRKIILAEPIKELGVYEIGIDIAPGVEAKIKLWVVKE